MEEYVTKCQQLAKKSDRKGLYKFPYIGAAWILFSFSILLAVLIFQLQDTKRLWVQYSSACAASLLCYFVCTLSIPATMEMFSKAGLFGKDLSKPGKAEEKPAIPEGLGLIIAVVFIVCEIFMQLFFARNSDEIIKYDSAILSFCLMALLGLSDDILNLRWRYKLVLPAIASLPLIFVYNGSTSILLPKFISSIVGTSLLNLGILYLAFIVLLSVFATNAINIYAGINGIEVMQPIIIGIAMIFNNVLEISNHPADKIAIEANLFSLSLLLPFIGCCFGLLKYNCFPSRVFIGDTFCYFSGMTLAVSAIHGHNTKTLLCFLLPQVLNFLLSVPQVFCIIPCPRHRIPKFNEVTGKMEAVHSHFTIINMALRILGPINENQLVGVLSLFQMLCCFFVIIGKQYFLPLIY